MKQEQGPARSLRGPYLLQVRSPAEVGKLLSCAVILSFGEYRDRLEQVALAVMRKYAPCFCVSSNLTRAEVVVHRNGPLVKALFASVGLPGILPPVHHGGDLLVDGGLLNNLPVDVGRNLLGSGTVIASDVSLSVELADIPQYGEALTGWQVLWSRLNPYAEAFNDPSIVELLHRSGLVSSIHRENSIIKQNAPDLYIDPPVEKYDLLGFRLVEELAELGYQFARGKVAEWQRVRAGP